MHDDGGAMAEQAWERLPEWLAGMADPLVWAERIIPGALFLLLGGLLGSFLNVVAYRLPRGGSVWGRRSHCPSCGTVVHSRDNVPVLGWLILRGRCRSCRGPISARYPLVEAGMALAVWGLAEGELLTNGANLPGRIQTFPTGPDLVFVHASWDVLAIFVWHVALLATLAVWSLFAIDQHRPAGLRLVGAIALMAVVGMAFPLLLPLDLEGSPDWQVRQPLLLKHMQATMIALVGASVGGICGVIPAMSFAPRTAAWPWIAGGALIGAVTGWQTALLHAVLGFCPGFAWCGLCRLVLWRKGCRMSAAAVPAAALVALVFWENLLEIAASIFAR